MKAYRILPARPGEIIDLPNELHALQREVDGYIETVSFPGWCVICNEEGKLKGMDYNFYLEIGGRMEAIFGPVLIVGTDGEEFTDVTDAILDELGAVTWR